MASQLTCVDLFAGLGGNSEGARQAGVEVLVAANHWAEAVKYHAKNHPGTHHLCQDLQQANFYDWPDFDILLGSPACQGHSRARGKDRPHHDATRSTAWAMVACAEAKRPKFFMTENVPDFMNWNLYPEWSRCLEKLGYTLSSTVIDAADLGVPQHRRRLFVVGVHKDVSTKPVVIEQGRHPHIPAHDIIDFTAGRWSDMLKPGRAMATLKRWVAGHIQFGHKFVMPYFGSGSGKTGRDLARPLGTITTRDRWAVVRGNEMRMLTKDECKRAMGFPAHYILPEQHKAAIFMLGNAVVPAVTKHVIQAMQAHLAN